QGQQPGETGRTLSRCVRYREPGLAAVSSGASMPRRCDIVRRHPPCPIQIPPSVLAHPQALVVARLRAGEKLSHRSSNDVFLIQTFSFWPSVSVIPFDKSSEGPHFTPHSV